MALLTTSNPIPGTALFANVTGTPQGGWDPTFDSLFVRSTNPCLNCRLRIDLKVFLDKIDPNGVTDFIIRGLAGLFKVPVPAGGKLGGINDSDDVPTLLRDWRAAEWQTFVNKFTTQANMWSCKFWLLPPDDFTHFEFTHAGVRYRPNVRCEFKVHIVGGSAGAHNTVQVVNVARPNGTFRSDGGLYSVEDTKPMTYNVPDSTFTHKTHTQLTVTHEIGHAIGLPHIGVTNQHLLCAAATLFEGFDPDANYTPALLQGGTDSQVCYGSMASAGDASNIMGWGNKFAPENAQPWLDRIPTHINRAVNMSRWKASMIRVAPKKVR